MKLIRTIALGAVLAVAASSVGAQAAPQTTRDSSARAQMRGKGEQRKAGREHGRVPGKAGHAGRGDRALLQGVNLSEPQRQQVRAIVERYRPQQRALMDQVRQRRESGQRPDSAFMAGIREQRRALQQRQVADIRAVLTEEQRTRFDANAERLRERAEQRTRRVRDGREHERGERPSRGDRGTR